MKRFVRKCATLMIVGVMMVASAGIAVYGAQDDIQNVSVGDIVIHDVIRRGNAASEGINTNPDEWSGRWEGDNSFIRRELEYANLNWDWNDISVYFVNSPATIESTMHEMSSLTVIGWNDRYNHLRANTLTGVVRLGNSVPFYHDGVIIGSRYELIFAEHGIYLLWNQYFTNNFTYFNEYFFFLVVGGEESQAAPNLYTASGWAHNYINRAYAANLIPQALQNNYTQATSRAEFTALAVALYEAATGRTIAGRMQFNDTTDINVQKMGYLGVVTGVGEGNFAPNNTLTREQAATMISRLATAIGQPLPTHTPTFADNAQIHDWAVAAVGQMQASGIMGGVGDNHFAPSGDYTREQSIITFVRLFEILN